MSGLREKRGENNRQSLKVSSVTLCWSNHNDEYDDEQDHNTVIEAIFSRWEIYLPDRQAVSSWDVRRDPHDHSKERCWSQLQLFILWPLALLHMEGSIHHQTLSNVCHRNWQVWIWIIHLLKRFNHYVSSFKNGDCSDWSSTSNYQIRYEEKNGLHVCSIHGKIGIDQNYNDEVGSLKCRHNMLFLVTYRQKGSHFEVPP